MRRWPWCGYRPQSGDSSPERESPDASLSQIFPGKLITVAYVIFSFYNLSFFFGFFFSYFFWQESLLLLVSFSHMDPILSFLRDVVIEPSANTSRTFSRIGFRKVKDHNLCNRWVRFRIQEESQINEDPEHCTSL
jgi:hypothetical protein